MSTDSKEGVPPIYLFLIAICVAALGLFFALKTRHQLIGRVAPYLAAAVLAGLIGYVDQHNDEVWAVLILILPAAFAFGFFLPRQAWQWALIIGGGVIGGSLIGLLMGHTPPCHPGEVCPPPGPGKALEALIALIPAMVEGYAGTLLRWGTSLYTHSTRG